MAEVTTMFAYQNPAGENMLERTPETDKLAEELLIHRHLEKHPTSTPPSVKWVRHYQPDCWLVFAIGTTEDNA